MNPDDSCLLTSSLSILIPTFDRPTQVSKRLLDIEREFGNRWEIVVQVNPGNYNASDVTVPTGLHRCSVVENQANIGMVANIVMGLKSINSKWLWILGDDDPVDSGSLSTLLSTEDKVAIDSPSAIIFNNLSPPHDGALFICRSIESLRLKTSFDDCLFISSLVWDTDFLRSNILSLVDYSFTRASHTVILLSALARGDACLCVKRAPIVAYETCSDWSKVDYLSRVFCIFNHPDLKREKSRLLSFMGPQLMWAFRTSAYEVQSAESLSLWLSNAFCYLWHVLTSQGLGAVLMRAMNLSVVALRSLRFWISALIRSIIIYKHST